MKYIPGTAKPIINKSLPQKINCYEVFIECDANDGDYMNTNWTQTEFSELECLLINYLGRYTGKWYSGHNGSHYGHHVVCTPLKDWLVENEWLLYAGMCDDYCHSISDIYVIYYNENGIPHDVTFPNVDNLFDSEEEFLNYVYKLIEQETND